jgi:hypothetical protein
VTSKSIERFKHRIREITGRSRGISMERRLGELRSFVRGWMGYYGLCRSIETVRKLGTVNTTARSVLLAGNVGDTFAHASEN